MKITLDEMMAFQSVVQLRSITAAAEALEQTTSGISRALRRLEKKLGVTLLQRTTRRLEMTEEGRLFARRAQVILQSVEATEALFHRAEPAGRLRVNAAPSFMQHVIVPLIGRFRAQYPRILLELNTDDYNIDLIARQTDIAIRIGALTDSTLHARFLGESALYIVASPDYIKKKGMPLTIEDLEAHTLIGFTLIEALNDWPLRDQQGVRIAPDLAASNGEIIRQLVLAGEGIACLSQYMLHKDIQAGSLISVLAEKTQRISRPVHAVYYSQQSPRVACFLDFLSQHFPV